MSRTAKLRIVLCSPASYKVGFSGATIPLLYTLFSQEGIECDLAFLDTAPYSLIEKRKLSEFDIVAFTVQYEWEYVNIARMLMSSGIKATKPRRKPIVVGGGPCITSNPEPLADILDVAVIGDAEVTVPKLCEAVSEGVSGIDSLAGKEGFYFFRERARRAIADEIASTMIPTIAAKNVDVTVYGRAARVEAVRGCPMLCRYCLIGWTARPYREKPIERVLSEVKGQLDDLNSRKAVFIGAGLTFYSRLEDLCRQVKALGVEGSIASIRPEFVSGEKLKAIRARGGDPLVIVYPGKTAVELVREGRGY